MILTKENIKQINPDDLINEKITKGLLDELLIIVPTNRRLRSLRKEIISMVPGKTTSSLNLETLTTISTNLLLQKASFKSLSDPASYVLLTQSISEVELKYFSGYSGEIPSGTISRISEVIHEYKRQGVTPEILRKEASSLEGGDKAKALDIANIYEKYQLSCCSLAAKELGDIYLELSKFSKEDFALCYKKSYPKVNLVIVDGFDEFSSLEVEILNLLADSSTARFFINFDYYKYNPLMFSHLDQCYQRLIKKGFNIITDNSYTELKEFKNLIREKLFLKTEEQKETRFTKQVTRLQASGKLNEIELIAKEIKELLLEKKAEPHQICVSFNLIDRYSPIIRDIFSKYGIPFNLTDRYRLSDSTTISSIINFLEILENDFYYRNIFRSINSRVFEIAGIDFVGLMKISRELKIVSGYNNWIDGIEDRLAIIDNEIKFSNREELERERKQLKTAMQNIKTLYMLLEPFTKKQNYSTFLTNLKNLLVKLGFYNNIVKNLNSKSELNIKAATEFIETIDEVFRLFELKNKEKEYPVGFYLEKIRALSLSTRYNVHEKSKYGVQITTLNEIRGLKFDYLFICGLCDGDFPTRYNPEIFFTGSFVKGEQNHQNKERYHFYQGLSSWQKGLYLTFPAQEDNRELSESSFLKDFCNIFEVSNKTHEDYENAFYTKEDVLKTIGQINNIDLCRQIFKDIDIIDWTELEHALKVAAIRNQKKFNSVYSGCLNEIGNDLNENLPETIIKELNNIISNQFSVTSLEKYAACPFQYFLANVLKVDIIEEPSEEIESFEIGTLLHEILYEFYFKLRNKGITLGRCSNNEFKIAEEMMFSIAEEKIKEKNFKSQMSFYEHEKILGINGDRKNSILYKFLEFERENSSEFTPELFELSFGWVKGDQKKGETLHFDSYKLENLRIGGQIDRIEINETEKVFNIVDYKLSGKKPTADELQDGLSLQLPVYMMAAKEMLKELKGKDYNPGGAYIYSLKFKDKDFGKIPVNTKSNKTYELLDEDGKVELINKNEDLIDNCKEKILLLIENIKVGRFNLSLLEDRENKVCRYCGYKSVCRIQEMT